VLRLLGAILLVALALAAATSWVWRDYNAPGPLAQSKIVVIPRGEGLDAIAATLAENGVVRHPYVFFVGAVIDDRLGTLKAGEYEFAAAIRPHQRRDRRACRP